MKQRKPCFEQLEHRLVLSVTTNGDYDGNGFVNGNDFLVWARSGDHSQQGLAAWQSNFGKEVVTLRPMENLDRGVVATRSGSSVFVGWRSLAHDPVDVQFNLYRSTDGGAPVRINREAVGGPTIYTDTTADLSKDNSYFVAPVIGGFEQAASAAYTLAAFSPTGPYYTVPMRDIGSNYNIRHVSVGDLNGDGLYDFVVARRSGSSPQIIDAYLHDGTFLWSIDTGPNGFGGTNFEPGSSEVDLGNWDGIQVYDLDSDGKAEVFYRSANGVVFGDGTTLVHPDDNVQFISAIDGMTGAERARIQVPNDYIEDGPMGAMTGIGYLDGERPSLIVKMKNRVGSGPFNMLIAAYEFDGELTEKWVWHRGNQSFADGHNLRIADVDGDGDDEVADIGFVLEGDGSVKYNLTDQGIVHGDRFYIGDFDPARPGLEGYGVQQNNPSLLMEYYYDAATGEILHTVYGTSLGDNGRGDVGDIDPTHPGMEFWSFFGLHNIYNSQYTHISSSEPWPHLQIQWDGDLLSERLSADHAVIDQWNPASESTSRVATLYNMGSGATTNDGWPIYFGDITGDWREEVIYERGDRQALVVFTTQTPTSTRLYSLAQNPLYRNNMTLKGYLQSRNLDYYLGDGMSTPPTPNTRVLDFGNDAAPTVATPASTTLTNIVGATTDVSVLGTDDGGEQELTYTWAGVGPGKVSFSANKTNDAKDSTATFTMAGDYTLIATIRDACGQTVTSRVNVSVIQTQSGLTVSPTGIEIAPGSKQQFAAAVVDQFGDLMPNQPTFMWTVISGPGSVDASGLYTASGAAGVATVQAIGSGLSGTATVNVSNNIAPLARWKLDESSGTSVSDSSGNGLDGTTMNGPAWVTGVFDNALSFDGTDDYVDLPTSIVDSSAGSVAFWFKTGVNFSDAAHMFYASPQSGGNGGGAETELHLNFLNNETIQFFIRGNSDNVSITTTSTYADNLWHHIAATWDINDNAVLYIDGAPVGSMTHNADPFTNSYVTRLGRPDTNSRHFNGLMDDVRLYDVAIGATQVQNSYNEGTVPLATATAFEPAAVSEVAVGEILESLNDDLLPYIDPTDARTNVVKEESTHPGSNEMEIVEVCPGRHKLTEPLRSHKPVELSDQLKLLSPGRFTSGTRISAIDELWETIGESKLRGFFH